MIGAVKFGAIETPKHERDSFAAETRLDIHGWNGHGVFLLMEALSAYQQKAGICGALTEIGVHHGQFFVYMLMLMRRAERAVAIDLFEDQHLNMDQSGRGDRQVFTDNIRRFTPKQAERVAIRAGDSLSIASGEIATLAEMPVRMFSIDGGHWRDVVVNDLFLAADALHEGGVAILDDVFNPYFPGVGEGLSAYIHDAPPPRFAAYRNAENRLRPFAIGCNKVLLCLPQYWGAYNEWFGTQFAGEKRRVEAQGWGVDKIIVLEY